MRGINKIIYFFAFRFKRQTCGGAAVASSLHLIECLLFVKLPSCEELDPKNKRYRLNTVLIQRSDGKNKIFINF